MGNFGHKKSFVLGKNKGVDVVMGLKGDDNSNHQVK